jgi:metal-responsive CopG/Arc/MetJ family transcriptional regulator
MTARIRTFGVGLPDDLVAKIDKRRGLIARSRWIAVALEEHLEQQEQQQAEVQQRSSKKK